MKIQIALDDISMEAALQLMDDVAEYVDIIEIGTPFLLAYGMQAVRTMKGCFPDKEILCDAKIMDGGKVEADLAFEAGADYVTVLGVTDQATVKAVVNSARAHGKTAVVDLMCVADFESAIPKFAGMGVDMAAIHVGVDQQQSGRTPWRDLKRIKTVKSNIKIGVAGGINAQELPEYLPLKPDVIIVGGAITKAADPVVEARKIYLMVQEVNLNASQ